MSFVFHQHNNMTATIKSITALAVLALALLVTLTLIPTSTAQDSAVVFDENISLQYLQYAYAAFCRPEELETWSCQWCIATNFTVVDTVYDPLTEAYGFVGYNTLNKTIVISFRGTSNDPNWIDDFDIILVPYPGFNGSRIHEGFYTAWKRMESQVYSIINTILASRCPSCTHVVTTGHSLGAALSGVAALEIATTYNNVTVSMNNFGMPRVGNPDYAQAFMYYIPTAQRMVHQDDIVPHVPPIDFGYHHPAYEIWDLSNSTEGGQRYIVCDSSGEDPNCSDSIPAIEWKPDEHMTYMGVVNNVCGV